MNFVKTQLYLDKLNSGEMVEVTLNQGEARESVSKSITAEGHVIELDEVVDEEFCRLLIRKS